MNNFIGDLLVLTPLGHLLEYIEVWGIFVVVCIGTLLYINKFKKV